MSPWLEDERHLGFVTIYVETVRLIFLPDFLALYTLTSFLTSTLLLALESRDAPSKSDLVLLLTSMVRKFLRSSA